MKRQQITQIIERRMNSDGLLDTGIEGVKLFRATKPMACSPSVYEPSVTAILTGTKKAIWGGQGKVYDSSQYICCTVPMPVEAGIPEVSPENPLLGVYISLNTRVMTELVVELESEFSLSSKFTNEEAFQGILVSGWDDVFTEALLRLLQLSEAPEEISILGNGRLREFYYAVLSGEVGNSLRSLFGMGNHIARSIQFLSLHLHQTITIEDVARHVGMSRAVFHRKFKKATSMSPIQFMKSMRLNSAAMKIASGTNVSVAAAEVGYESSSQFSREFKRMYGLSPKKWVDAHHRPESITS